MGRDLSASGFLPVGRAGQLIGWMGEVFIYKRAGIVLAQFFCSAAYAVRVLKASFDEVSPRLEGVALTLGCTRWQALRRVTLPLVRPGIAAGAVLTWARAMGIFGAVMILAGGVRGRTEVLPTTIYLEISVGRLEMALAVALIMAALSLVVLLVFRLTTRMTVFGTGGQR